MGVNIRSFAKKLTKLKRRALGAVAMSQISPQSHNDFTEVAILLCTYNGQQYLAEQLDSFETQMFSSWAVWASDDGSQDETLAILETYRSKWEKDKLSIQQGPGRGFVHNFFSLIFSNDIRADYYAFSDQDDIWDKDKLKRAVNYLKTMPESIPALYCSRTLLVDAKNHQIGLSPLFSIPPNFKNALVQNIGGGNTMVFNNAARQLVAQVSQNVDVVSHDWWTYMLVTGCGGHVFYDPNPAIRYRQHSDNLVGMNRGLLPKLIRVKKLLGGRFKHWNDANLKALELHRNSLTEDNKVIFDIFYQARKKGFIPRIWGIARSGVKRQSKLGTAGIYLAALFNKI